MSPYKNPKVEIEILPRLQQLIKNLKLEEKETSIATLL